MMRSMLSAVSGLRMQQLGVDTVGNNIANVNTPGFKASRVNFVELFTQTLKGASAPTATQGGTAPSQIGLGVTLGGIQVDNSQGSLQTTNNNFDLALQGSGYFVVRDGSGNQLYTRVGDLGIDAAGNLVQKSTGDLVLGWAASNGSLGSTASAPVPLSIPQGATVAPTATSTITFGGNLDAMATPGQAVTVPETVYDSLGNPTTVDVTFTASATPGMWTWSAGGTTPTFAGGGTITFTASGAVTLTTGATTLTGSPTDGATTLTITPDFSGLTDYAQASTAAALSQNGGAAGQLESTTFDSSGVITGAFTNGKTEVLGQVAVASFSNPSGLLQQGNGLDAVSNDSGQANIGTANSGGRGKIMPGSLEGSNVDLGQQFTDMIQFERGFQANAQVVTVSNQMLQSLNQMVG